MMIVKRLLAAAMLSTIAVATAMAQMQDPLLGTWKLNAAKSNSTYKSGTSVFEAAGDGIKATVDLVATDGTAYHWSFSGKYDGKDNPVTGSNPFGDSVALTRIDAHTVKLTVKQGGKETVTQTIVIAPDGKSRTTTVKGMNAQGQPIEGMSYYEKQ